MRPADQEIFELNDYAIRYIFKYINLLISDKPKVYLSSYPLIDQSHSDVTTISDP